MIDMTRSDASQHPRGYQRACNARRRREAASWPGPLHPAAVERRGCPLDVVHDVDVVLVAHPQLVQLPPQALQPAHLRLCQATPEPHPPRPVASHVTPPRQAGAGAAPAPQPAPPVLLEADVPRGVTSGVPGTLAAQCRRAQVPGVVGSRRLRVGQRWWCKPTLPLWPVVGAGECGASPHGRRRTCTAAAAAMCLPPPDPDHLLSLALQAPPELFFSVPWF